RALPHGSRHCHYDAHLVCAMLDRLDRQHSQLGPPGRPGGRYRSRGPARAPHPVYHHPLLAATPPRRSSEIPIVPRHVSPGFSVIMPPLSTPAEARLNAFGTIVHGSRLITGLSDGEYRTHVSKARSPVT